MRCVMKDTARTRRPGAAPTKLVERRQCTEVVFVNLRPRAHSTPDVDARRPLSAVRRPPRASVLAGAGRADAGGGGDPPAGARGGADGRRAGALAAGEQVHHADDRDRTAGIGKTRGTGCRRAGRGQAGGAGQAPAPARSDAAQAKAAARTGRVCTALRGNARPDGGGCYGFRSNTARSARQRAGGGAEPQWHGKRHAGRHRGGWRRSLGHHRRHPGAADSRLGHARFRSHGPDRGLPTARRVRRTGLAAGRQPLRRAIDAQGGVLHLAELAQHRPHRPFGPRARALLRKPQGRGGLAFRARPGADRVQQQRAQRAPCWPVRKTA